MRSHSAQLRPVPGRWGQVISQYRPHRYPGLTAIFVVWLAGLFFMFLAPAPRKVTPAMQQRFDLAIKEVCSSLQWN